MLSRQPSLPDSGVKSEANPFSVPREHSDREARILRQADSSAVDGDSRKGRQPRAPHDRDGVGACRHTHEGVPPAREPDRDGAAGATSKDDVGPIGAGARAATSANGLRWAAHSDDFEFASWGFGRLMSAGRRQRDQEPRQHKYGNAKRVRTPSLTLWEEWTHTSLDAATTGLVPDRVRVWGAGGRRPPAPTGWSYVRDARATRMFPSWRAATGERLGCTQLPSRSGRWRRRQRRSSRPSGRLRCRPRPGSR